MDKEQLTDWLEFVIAWAGGIPKLPVLIFFSIIGLGIGIFMIFYPTGAIEIQRKCYEKINWKIEPISMPREIRNTRLMGCFLIVSLAVLLYFILSKNLLSP